MPEGTAHETVLDWLLRAGTALAADLRLAGWWRAAVYERLGIPTVATVPWSTDRLMRMLLPDGVASAWRETPKFCAG